MKPFTDILNSTLAKFTTDLNFVGMSSVSLNEYANVSCTLHEEEGASPLLTLMTNNVRAGFSVTDYILQQYLIFISLTFNQYLNLRNETMHKKQLSVYIFN